MDSRLEQSRRSPEQLIRLQQRTGSVTRTWDPLEGCPPARPKSLMGAPQQPGAAMNYKPGGRWDSEESRPTVNTLINHFIHGGRCPGPAVSAERRLMCHHKETTGEAQMRGVLIKEERGWRCGETGNVPDETRLKRQDKKM